MKRQSADGRAVDEAVEGRPRWKNCLIVAVIAAAVLAAAGFIFARWIGGSGPKRIQKLPESFPVSFAVFRPEDADRITLYSASEKRRPFALVALPLRLIGRSTSEADAVADRMERSMSALQDADTVSVEWSNLDASVQDILLFYAGSMIRSGVADPKVRATDEGDVTELVGEGVGVSAQLLVIDDPNTHGIENVLLTVDYRPSNRE